MARVVGPAEAQRTIQTLNGRTGLYGGFANRKVTWYTDAAGTQLADIRSYNPTQPSTVGSAITGSAITLDHDGRAAPFWFPDGVTILYGRVARGPIVRVSGDLQDTSAGSTVVNVQDYGAKGDGVTDDTTAIRAALAASAGRYYFPAGTYVVSGVAEGTTLGTFTGRTGVTIDAAEATISNPTSYTADTITPMFLFDNCREVEVNVGHYVGFTLPTPTSFLGYRGATLVRLINGCVGARIDARITNARYGVQSGEYADQTKGYCRDVDVKLRTSFCGYPVALYLAEGVRYDIDADDVHRVAYLAGCQDVRGVARWKNQYIADICTLITDAKTGTGTSRGCADLDVTSIDKGSSVFQSSTMCAGIALSRVDPGITYENIKVRVHSIGTDTQSSTVGAFTITSGAKTLTTPVADYNWEPTITLRNISISGVIDKSAQTIASNTAGTIFVRAYDTLVAHSATIENLIYEDLVIKESSGVTRMCYLEAPGITGTGVMFRNVSAPTATLEVLTNTTTPVTLVNSVLKELNIIGVTGGSRVELVDSTIGTITGTANIGNTGSVNSRVAGAGALIRQKQWLLDLTSGATVTQASAIPANVLILGVTGYITASVTGPTTLQVGVTGDPARYLSTTTLTAGTGLGLDKRASTEQVPWYAPSTASSLVATAVGGNFTAGQIRVSLSYIELPAPTA